MTRPSLQARRVSSSNTFPVQMPRLSFKMCMATAIACWIISSASAASIFDLLKPKDLVAEAGAPIPVSATSYTWKDYNKLHADWCQRHVLAPFDKVAEGKAWKADARKLLEQVVPIWLHSRKHSPTELMDQGRKLLAGGCDDPLVRYFTFWLERVCLDEDALHDYRGYEKALRQLEKETRYPRAMAVFVANDLSRALMAGQSSGKHEKLEVLDKQIVELTREALEQGSYDGADDMLFVRHTLHCYSNRRLRRLADGLEELYTRSAKLPAWVKHTLMGYIEVQRAWKDRGGGWAYTVTEKGWTGFAEHLNKARAELSEGWRLRPDRPEAAAQMITVVMGGHGGPGDTLRLWFDRAVKAQFDYMTAYNHLSWALQPRWGGSHDAMFAFARACADTKRYDTQVPDFFFEVMRDITLDSEDNRTLYLLPRIADGVMELDRTLLEAPERKSEIQDRLSFIVFHGWLCHRFEEARKALDQLEGSPTTAIKSDLRFFNIARSAVISDVYVLTSEAKADFEKARELGRARDYEAAARHYQAAIEKIKGPEIALKTLKIDLNMATGDAKLMKGGWVNVSPKAGNLAEGWDWRYGKWEAPADGVMQIRSRNEEVLANCQLHVGADFEMRADVEIDAPTDTGQAIGVVLGYSRLDKREWLMCEVWKGKPGTTAQATLFNRFRLVDNPLFPVALEKKNHLHVQCWKNQVTFYLNGKRVFKDLVSKKGSVEGINPKCGFGAHALYGANTTRISNIEVRLLKEPPKPPE